MKFYFKVIYPIKAHYITRQLFSVFVEWRMSFWELIIAYLNIGQWVPFS